VPHSFLPELVSNLSNPPLRQRAADALAARLGVEEVLLLVKDPVLPHWIPAGGLPQTVAGGPAWRALLAACERPGRHVAEVDLPQPQLRRAVALAATHTVAVLVGGQAKPDELASLEQLLPLLDALLQSQQEAAFSKAEAVDARQAAARAQSLAEALDAARSAAARLNAELRVEQQRRDEFLTMMTQELHNPLAPLIKAVKVLRQAEPSGSNSPVFEMMARKLTHLSRMADDLLDVSRAFRGEIDLVRAPVAMQTLVREALENSLPFVEKHGHRVELQLLDEPVIVHADRIRLTQVISKLLHNAAKYSQPGGCIVVRVARDGADAMLEVADDGIGISPGMMPRIFEMFTQVPVRTDPAGAGLGLGVGLTLVRIVMALHGGNIKATSAGVGRGSVFTMRLPVLVDGEPAAATPDAAALGEGASTPLRVLVVDGNAEAAQSLAGLFRLLGHRAAVASDGPTALAYLSDHHADLILLDIDLRGMDSYEVVRRLRLSPHGRSLIVALTVSGAEGDKGRSLEAGFDDHLVKPADRQALEAALAGMTPALRHQMHSA
jgi:signal transduction histidine kinase/ActR/RegA family two-component response regulator